MAEIERRPITDRALWLEWRRQDMTASVGACLFGDDLHPYTTAYEQWALKSKLVASKPLDLKLARQGVYIEKIAPEIIAEVRPGWLVAPNRYYYRDPDANIGSTPDCEARREDIDGVGNIQVKGVGPQAFRKWRDRDTGETALPVWIAIQANIEAAMMGATWASVAAITIGDGGLDIEIIDVDIVPEVMETFRGLAQEFWRRVREKDPYPVDWGRDAAVILDMYRDDDGSIIDLTDDPMARVILMQRDDFKRLEAEGAEAERRRKILDAHLINLMGNAATARVGSRLIKAPTIRVKEALRQAYTFRKLSVTGHEARDAAPSLADSAS